MSTKHPDPQPGPHGPVFVAATLVSSPVDKRKSLEEATMLRRTISLATLIAAATLLAACGGSGASQDAAETVTLTDDMGREEDGIFQTLRDAALIQQTGGGTGFSFSRLRPRGAVVRSSGGRATGPVGFMRVYDVASGIVSQGGASGKSPGTDLREGIATLPVLFATAGDDPAEARLRELVAGPVTDDAEHAEALALLRSSASLARANDVLGDYADRARARLDAVPAGDVRDALSALCDYVVTRTS